MEQQQNISFINNNFMSEVLERSSSNSPQKPNFSTRKVNSLDRHNNNHQFRQTVNFKKFKSHKMSYQSKPISIGNYDDNLFAMQPKKSYGFLHQPEPVLSAKRMPVNNNTWVNNSKRVQKKINIIKRGSADDAASRFRPIPYDQINQQISHDLKDYLQSVKSYFMQHKKKVQKERKIKVSINNQIRYHLEDQGNLNIIRLKPSTPGITRRPQTIENERDEKESSPTVGYQSQQNFIESSPTYSKQKQRMQIRTSATNRGSQRILRQKKSKKVEYHYIFGEYKQFMTDQAIQKLKILYYRDFIWKISFNRNFFLESVNQTYKYYVGKGNNSRLIRRIMNKRPWWTQDNKQENAHFIWTQLKIYDVYKNQRCINESKVKEIMIEQKEVMSSTGFLTASQFFPQKSQVFEPLPHEDKNSYILNHNQYKKWRSYIVGRGGIENKPFQDMRHRFIQKIPTKKITHKISNHLEFSRVIGNKKALYRTMQAYLNFMNIEDQYLPLTFLLTGGLENEEYLQFLRIYYKRAKQGFTWWIVKPGQLSNRGKDIKYCNTLQKIKQQIKKKKVNANGGARTYLVQSYIDRPLLYQKRKFDFRHYFMVTSTQGVLRGYFYQEGYIRTTSYPYSLDQSQPGVHLTNDAVQKSLPNYSKYQKANKLSYQQLDQYMLKKDPSKGFFNTIFPQIKKIVTDVIFASYPFIDTQRRANNFQIFGMDVMVDSNLKCWLIEVNTNPCFEVNCKILANIIPHMLDNAFTIGLDGLVSPPQGKPKIQLNNYLTQNKFQLVFDEQIHGPLLEHYKHQNIDNCNYGDDDDNYESCQQDEYDF